MVRMMTYLQMSKYSGIRVSTLYSMVSRKQIPHVRLGPRLVRFPRDELDRWIAERLVEPANHEIGGDQ